MMNSTLTAGQQGVLDMYDKEIAHYKHERAYHVELFVTGAGNYEHIRRLNEKIDELQAERQTVLEQFMGQA